MDGLLLYASMLVAAAAFLLGWAIADIRWLRRYQRLFRTWQDDLEYFRNKFLSGENKVDSQTPE